MPNLTPEQMSKLYGTETCSLCGQSTPKRNPADNNGNANRKLRLMFGDRSMTVKLDGVDTVLKWKSACDRCAAHIAKCVMSGVLGIPKMN